MSLLSPQIETALHDLGAGEMRRLETVAGGDINEAYRVHTQAGQTFFLKRHSNSPPGMFEAEAAGLAALRGAFSRLPKGGARLTVPEAYAVGQDFLLMEDLGSAPRRADFFETLGRGLAQLHACHGPAFGFFETDNAGHEKQLDNYCGLTPQPNPRTRSGYTFFAEYRLRYQAKLAASKNLLDRKEVRTIDIICNKLPELIPEQPPSLIHGDLWNGNVCTSPDGAPALIDPATHFGWAEADLAMTKLFGGFAQRFYDAYREAHSLPPGWDEREKLYNLYHLLNHVNLFGRGYLSSVQAITQRYA